MRKRSKWKCYLLGHDWAFVANVKEDVEIPLKNPIMAKTYMEKHSRIWQCAHCGNVVKTNINKKPKPNLLRRRLAMLNDFFNVLIK